MSDVLGFSHGLNSAAERRKHARQRPNSLTYIELEKENGGIVLDASENGFSVQAVVSLADDLLPHVRLRLADSKEWLEFRARVVWTRESRKVVGLEFEELPEQSRAQLRQWLAREVSDAENRASSSTDVEDATNIEGATEIESTTASEDVTAAVEETAADDGTTADLLKSDANQSSGPSGAGAKVAEIRPALVLVDYTDQSGPDDSIALQPGAKMRSSLGAPSGSLASAKVLPALSPEAQERTVGTEPEKKQLSRAPGRQPVPTSARPRQASGVAWVYAMFCVLGAGSLTGGWAAGRGKFAPAVERLHAMLRQEQASAAVIERSSQPPAAPVSAIEVVDAAGQRRDIPLQVAAASPAVLSVKLAVAGGAAPVPKPAMNFQVWTLSAPQRSASSGAAAKIPASAPPAITTANEGRGTPRIAEIASGDATNGYAMVPKPDNSTGVLTRGALLHRVQPEYPEIARDQGVSGTVVLKAHVGVDGAVGSVSVVSGPKLLIAAAENAVRQWRYAPTLLDGKPIETQVQISLVFRRPGDSQ